MIKICSELSKCCLFKYSYVFLEQFILFLEANRCTLSSHRSAWITPSYQLPLSIQSRLKPETSRDFYLSRWTANSTPSSLGLSSQNRARHGQLSGRSPYELLKSTKSRCYKTTPGQEVESKDRLSFCDLGIMKDAELILVYNQS